MRRSRPGLATLLACAGLAGTSSANQTTATSTVAAAPAPSPTAAAPAAPNETTESVVAVDLKGVRRVLPPQSDGATLEQSIAILHRDAVVSSAEVPEGVKLRFTSNASEHAAVVDLEDGTSLFGAGGAPGSLLRNGQTHECWPAAPASERAAWPWALAVRADGTAYGILADTARACTLELGASSPGAPAPGSITIRAQGGPFAVVVIQGSSPVQVVERLTRLTGTPPMAPMWAFNHMHAGDPANQESVLDQAKGLRDARIPGGVVVLPAGTSGSERSLAFDPAAFASPKPMNQQLEQLGYETVWTHSMLVPDVSGMFVRDQLVNSNFALRDAKDKPAAITTSSLRSVAPDLSRPETRAWWSKAHREVLELGVDGMLIDPSTSAIPPDSRVLGGDWLEGQTLAGGEFGSLRGSWSLLAAGSENKSLMDGRKDRRPFVLTNEPTLGSQRYGAMLLKREVKESWPQSLARLLNASFSGQSLAGLAPAAGADPHQFALEALLPISVGDALSAAKSDDAGVRQSLERRARLMPYLYSCAARASESGEPLLRPVFCARPADAALRAETGSFLLGADVLVVAQGDQERVLGALNSERDHGDATAAAWERVNLVDEAANPSLPLLYIRPGAIVPVGPVTQSTHEEHGGPLVLLVNLDENGQAAGELYEDFGDGPEHLAGKFLRTTYSASLTGTRCKVEIASKDGLYPRAKRDMLVVLLRPGGWSYRIKGVDGMSVMFDIARREQVVMGDSGSVPGKDPQPPVQIKPKR